MIKFRAWHKGFQEMMNVKAIEWDNSVITYGLEWLKDDPDNSGILICHDQHIELMQCTGFIDKKGLDIYEGDIIIAEYGFADKPYTIEDLRDFYWNIKELGLDAKDIEIVGNKFEKGETL